MARTQAPAPMDTSRLRSKRQSMSINRRSKNITEGVARAPNRSMYYALGYEESDFKKPMIGVANGHSTITPCNSGLQKLADAAIAAIEEAGGNAQVFGTPTISDGMAMGTEGMKYSLVSREVISDCIETCVGGQWMDGVLVVGGCDKNMPGGMMGMLRANVPAIYVYGGTILPGRYKGQDLNIVTKKAIENAVAVIMATGGSTNAVLHFLAIAHAADVDWSIDDFERMRKKVPVICDLKPSGKYLAVDLHQAGGIPQVMKLLLNA